MEPLGGFMKSIIVTRQESICKEGILRLIGFKQNTDHGNWIIKRLSKEEKKTAIAALTHFKIKYMERD